MKECQHCKLCYADDVDTCPEDGMPTLHTIAGEPILEGKYHLVSRVGQGGMGVVYKAKHAYLKTLHAIKIILPDLVGNDPQLVQRFRQEALAAAAIRHQNVVNVTDYGVAQGTMPFLVMEFVEGEDLHDFLAREKRLKPERAFELTSAICKGIGAAHSQGIVHRDMKPLNIMLLNDKQDMAEKVKILDFGLAKIKSGELLGSFIQAQTTGLMGSPYYMAPEQWSDEDLDTRSDIYSIGVMLFQMLTGDVPFKGSSIPAIMKKHLTDNPPTFAELGVDLSPEIEKAVRRTLEKKREKRTPTVDVLIEELGAAVGYVSPHATATGQVSLPVSTLKVLTNPAKSEVYLNDVSVGESETDGWLMLEGLQSGNHNLRVSHEGYDDWKSTVSCDGSPRQVIVELKAAGDVPAAAPPAAEATLMLDKSGQQTPPNISVTQRSQNEMQATAHQNMQTGSQEVASSAPQKKWYLSPLVFAVIGISGLLLLTAIGGVGAYMFGLFGGTKQISSTNQNGTATPTVDKSRTKTPTKTAAGPEIAEIPGGEFLMGRNDGLPQERPEHKISVESFGMYKSEVTNSEYYDFVKETGHRGIPSNWENGKPFAKDLKMPVRFVSFMDAQAFAGWKTEKEGARYRLPTEAEWEYAARNGADNNLYPWGDRFASDCVVIDQATTQPKPIGGRECGANKWGVQDLIGNVFEWTSSEPSLYPGSNLSIKKLNEPHYMIRGGSANFKSTGNLAITSTFRVEFRATGRDQTLGFRLVRESKQQ